MEKLNNYNREVRRIYIFSLLSGFLCAFLTFESFIGLGLSVYALLNSVLLYLFLKDSSAIKNKRAFFWLIPIVLIAFSYVIRANRMFSVFNYFVMWLLFCTMFLDLQNKLNIFSGGFGFLWRSLVRLFSPLAYFDRPFTNCKTLFSFKSEKSSYIAKIILGLSICIPLAVFVLFLLSSADMVFSLLLSNFFNNFDDIQLDEFLSRVILSLIIAIYFFCQLFVLLIPKKERVLQTGFQQVNGCMYNTPQSSINVNGFNNTTTALGTQLNHNTTANSAEYIPITQPCAPNVVQAENSTYTMQQNGNNLQYMPFQAANVGVNNTPQKAKRDEPNELIIFLMVNCLLFVIYLFFAVIQINYLFMGSTLPEGFTYSEYARQGFFELLTLTFINIGVMLLTVNMGKKRIYEKKVFGSTILKFVMLGLSVLTMGLLVSSFYKMTLYSNAYGLTRLRVLVMIFLCFEAIGLVVTMLFIAKPTIKIIAAYTFICLAFYTSVNLINIDGIIAKNHLEIYSETGDIDRNYLSSLSADAHTYMLEFKNLGALESDDIDFYSEIYLVKNWPDYSTDTLSWKSYCVPLYKLYNVDK